MEIRNLKDTPLADIVGAITDSFADYFVQLSADVDYWQQRFEAARVDYELSFGMFDNGVLIGFIINGVDELRHIQTAFNTGTGVTAAARGHKVIDRLYAYAEPYFKEKGIGQCTLEVISQNERAIHVYERIGFHVSKDLKCFKGVLPATDPSVTAQRVPFEQIADKAKKNDHLYSWDNTTAAIAASNGRYHCYEVHKGEQTVGYFIINPATTHLIQFEAVTEEAAGIKTLLSGIATVAPEVKINNVDGSRKATISALQEAGLENFIDQHEMLLSLS